MKTTVHPAKRPLRGHLVVPGDKSISHRALLFGALADGESTVSGALRSGDCRSTLACLRALGVRVDETDAGDLVVHGVGLRGLSAPSGPVDCGRSGTTMRLLAGILAGQSFPTKMTGDEQLLRRPMRRIVDPLRAMGADIEAVDGRAPLRIRPAALRGVEHTLDVASAQVKSAALLAGLYADGPTVVRQCGRARDHTERLLAAIGATVRTDALVVTIEPPASLYPFALRVPGDISSAAFPLVAALLVPGSEIILREVGLNPTRTGLLDVLRRMDARIDIENRRLEGGEPVGDLTVRASRLTATTIGGECIVRMIDELPILAVAAAFAHGTTLVHDARELRVKETDRIETIVSELTALGARIESQPDGFVIHGPTPLSGGAVDSHRDHRLAMALTVAGFAADGDVELRRAEYAADSYPGFFDDLRSLEAGDD